MTFRHEDTCHADYSCKNWKWIKGLTLDEEYLEEEDFLQGSSGRNAFRPHGDYYIHSKALAIPNFCSHFQCQFHWYNVVGTCVSIANTLLIWPWKKEVLRCSPRNCGIIPFKTIVVLEVR